MAGLEIQPATKPPPPEQSVIEVIAVSAKEAFASAILVWVLGGVALGVAGSFAGEMVPSPPPGFTPQGQTGPAQANPVHAASHATHVSLLAVFFSIFFAHSLWVGFHADEDRALGRSHRILSNLREKWFSMLAGNAISAWIAALLLGVIPNFSFTHLFWDWAWGQILPTVQSIGRFVFGTANSSSVSDWVSWYHGNQSKLYFWVIYLGGMFDDLGVPNFKTLARWAWRRTRKPKTPTLASTTARIGASPPP